MRRSGAVVTPVTVRRPLAERLEPRQLLSGAPPVLTSFAINPDPVPAGIQMTLWGEFTDAEGDELAVWFYRETNGLPGLQTTVIDNTPTDEHVRAENGNVQEEDGFGWILAYPPDFETADTRHTYYAFATDGDFLSRSNVLTAGVTVIPPKISATLPVTHHGDVFTIIVPVAEGDPFSGGVQFYQETNGFPGLQDDEGDQLLGSDSSPDYPGRQPAEYSITFMASGQVAEERTYYAQIARERTAVLRHTFAGPGGTPQDPYEPNHEFRSPPSFVLIDRRVENGLMFHPSNGEYYMVIPAGPGTLNVELTFPDPALSSDLVLEVYEEVLQNGMQVLLDRSVPDDWQPGVPVPAGPRTVSIPVVGDHGYVVRVFSGMGDTRPAYGLTFERSGPATVLARYLAYKNSRADGNDARPGVVADAVVDEARGMAWTPWFENSPRFTFGYSRGINAVVVDVAGLPAAAGGQEALSAADFQFRVGTGGDPTSWRLAPAPSGTSVRRGAGLHGADRVAITWPDGAITNTWLQVTTKPTAATGLARPDVFYFGNLIGDTGTRPPSPVTGQWPLRVDVFDLVDVRRNFAAATDPGGYANPYDYNQDGAVNNVDLQLTARNMRRSLGHVTPPPDEPAPEVPVPAPARPALRHSPITRSVFAESAILA